MQALIAKGVNKEIAYWYKDYLTNRHAYIEIKGVNTIRQLSIGCPQGGVLSTLLWNISFDDMLSIFTKSKVICVGYADDGCLLITGKDIKSLYTQMNIVLEQCQKWAVAYGLDISPEKTEYMLCTKQLSKSNKIPPNGLRLKDTQIERSESVTYLGLTIEHRLRWGEHIDKKVKAAKRHIFRLKGFIGKNWGPNPEMTKLAYTTCIRPAMLYASFAFARGLAKKHLRKLNSVQSLALRMTCNARRGTPTNGLEVISDVPPIELFLEGEAAKTAYWLIGSNDEIPASKGHLRSGNVQLSELGMLDVTSDEINKEQIWVKRYKTTISKYGNDISSGLRCYTDGSRTRNGTGAGVCLMRDERILRTRAYGLSKTTTVFQAEMHAIKMATSLIKSTFEHGSTVLIMCDSQAAILALENIDTKSQLVLRTKEMLNALGKDYDIQINWIKAHVQHKGNEMADTLAKTGSNFHDTESIPLSKAHVKETIKTALYKAWDRKWQTQPDCRQTFMFFPCIDRTKSKKISSMSRHDLGIMVRYLTGHAHLRRHNKIANTAQPFPVDFPRMRYHLRDPDDNHVGAFDNEVTCRLCKLDGKEETPHHLATECLGAWRTRFDLLGYYSFGREDQFDWDPAALLKFFKHYDLENKPNWL